jgi:hypothetical protein
MALADVSPATIEMLASNAEDLADAAQDRGLDEAATELEYVVEEADEITTELAARRFGIEPEVVEDLFAAQEGEILDPLEGRGAFWIMEIVGVTPSSIPPFEEARDFVERAYVLSVKTDAAREKAQAVIDGVATGAGLEAVADGHGLRLRTTDPFTRTSNVPGIGSVNEITASAFAMPVGEVAGPFEVAGSFFVVRVDSRTPYDAQMLAQEMQNLKIQASLSKSQGYIQDWYETAKAEVEVEDYRGAGY